ncbi:hypothetical protein ACWEOA_40680 [Streptomyces sp. NPDC004457]
MSAGPVYGTAVAVAVAAGSGRPPFDSAGCHPLSQPTAATPATATATAVANTLRTMRHPSPGPTEP